VSDIIGFRCRPELQARLRTEAKARGISLSKLITEKLEPDGDLVVRQAVEGDTTDVIEFSKLEAMTSCVHPKNRRAEAVGGHRCKDCGVILRGI
jgi:hypothetical protein